MIICGDCPFFVWPSCETRERAWCRLPDSSAGERDVDSDTECHVPVLLASRLRALLKKMEEVEFKAYRRKDGRIVGIIRVVDPPDYAPHYGIGSQIAYGKRRYRIREAAQTALDKRAKHYGWKEV